MNVILYGHGGSGNHGCEAIVRSTKKIINHNIILYSNRSFEDKKYLLDSICTVKDASRILVRLSPQHLFFRLLRVLKKEKSYYFRYANKYLLNEKNAIFLSIGGDNYCGYGLEEWLININNLLNKKRKKTILWGTSIEPEILNRKAIINDMHKYSLIITRETITYDALIRNGIKENVRLYPDPAFQLNVVNLPLYNNFLPNNTVGINVSPLVIKYEKIKGIVMKNIEALIDYIILKTNMNIALIPHVVWENNNDLVLLMQLYSKYYHTKRIVLVEDCNCEELKGFISNCRFFIGARTHSTIAAYSTCVPTLVLGYSVKANGIAQDIFGTYENYVIQVQSLENEEDLIVAFKWLKTKENDIRIHLQKFMPSYCARAMEAGEEIRKFI